MNRNKLAVAVKTALGAGALSLAMPYANTALAQDNMELEEVVITGSRISRPELDAVSPYTVVTGEEFSISGIINVEQKLSELPMTLPSFGPSSNNPGDGTARVDLRGLGSARTLVLVNGRRYIPATQSGVVDLNSIPGSLLKQVDVLTGGSSAVYGSDALAGVVNFQLVDDFEGVEISGLYDTAEEGDAEKYNIDITIGGNFDNGRGNAVVYASYTKREALFQGDRKYSNVALTDTTDGNGNPVLLPGGSSGVPGTRVFGGPTLPNGTGLGTFDSSGGGLPWVEPTSRFNYAPDNYLQLPQERYLVHSMAHYDVTDSARVYGEFTYSHNKVPQELAPTPAFTTIELNPNSAFFGPDVQAAFAATSRTTDTNGDGVIDNNDNLLYFIGRRMVENGSRQAEDTRDAFRILVGLQGDFNDNWSYDAYYSFANLENGQFLNNDVSASRFKQAVLVTDDGSACQDPSGGCAPLNIWGPGNISQEAINFVNVGATNQTRIEQEVIQATVTGELMTLGSATQPIAVVLGYEHRSDESSFRPDTFLSAGDVLGFNAGRATVGSYSSSEFFAEISVPLVQEKALAEDLTFWAAARTSDYDNLDDDVTSFAAALNWSPVENVKFRLGYQEAVRAPNVAELFLGQSNGFPGADDPCSSGAISSDTDRDLCVATGVSAGQVGVFTQANSQIEGLFGGNPNLQEETSETYTFGVVWQPTDNFDISVDYYDIEIEDAISVLGGGVNNVLDLCYNVIKQASSPFCQAISRRSDGNVSRVDVLNENIGLLETSGIDVNFNYRQDFDWGIGNAGSMLTMAFKSTFLEEFDITPVAALADRVDDCEGNFGNTCGSPLNEIVWNLRSTLSTGPWTFSALVRYLSEVDDDQIANNGVPSGELAAPSIDDEYYLDISVGYDFSDDFTVQLGVQNALDTEPSPVGASQEQANTFPSTYELFGPRVWVSTSYKF
jgi:outer membrane receptor protein involved in Fe transport